MNTVYIQPLTHRSRSVIRKDGQLLNPGILQWLTAQAGHYATVEGPDAIRFAIGLAGLAFSKDTAA